MEDWGRALYGDPCRECGYDWSISPQCGDITEIPTDEGKLYMATVLDLFSRRLLACPTSEHPDAQLVCDGIKIAAAGRGGRTKIEAVIFHTDRGSTYTASSFTLLCKDKLGIRQSMGRVGSYRQRCCRIVLLHPRTRSSVPAPLHHQGTSAHCGLGLVPRVLQHPTETQLGGDDGPGRLRTHRCPARRREGGGLMNTPTPSGDVSVTAPGCDACGAPLPAGRSRRFCSPACRQAAFRRRHQSAAAEAPLQPRRSRRQGTLYQCPDCETRYLAEQWCPDCSRPCQRLGAGGICPCCEEMITVEELTEDTVASQPLPAVNTPVHH